MIKNALMLFFISAAVLAFFLPAYLKMQALSEKNRAYEREIRRLELSTALSEEERRRLREDPEYFEMVAREKLGIIKDDEVIYKVLPPGQKSAPASSETAGLLKRPTDGLVDELEIFPEGTDVAEELFGPIPQASAVKSSATVAGKTTATASKKTTAPASKAATAPVKKTTAVKK
jgi:cell division protein FtsB